MIKSVKNKNLFLSYAALAFVYTYAGIAEKYPDYNGNALLTWFFTAACALVYSFAVSKFFSTDFVKKDGGKAPLVLLLTFCILYASSNVSFFASSLGLFDDFYSSETCVFFAAFFSLFCAFFIGKRGKNGIIFFGLLSSVFFFAWTFFGFFAFFTAKHAVLISSPLKLLEKTDFFGIIKDILYINADLAVFAYVLSKNESTPEKQTLKAAIPAGSAFFAAVSGANVLKNALLLGDRLLYEAENPNFTAIRMIPLFELPEICVAVNAFACIIKASVSVCCAFFALKDIYGEKYNGKIAPFLLFGAAFASALLICGRDGVTEFLSVTSAVACAALCFFVRYKNV